MRINDTGLALIKQFEGCKLKAYKDLVGVWTIGYGHTGGVSEGDELADEGEASELLEEDLTRFEDGVENLLPCDVNSNQFSALVCFAYNVGLGNLAKSTLLDKVSKLDWEGAAAEFLRWNRAGGKVVAGLTRRRQAESNLFRS